MFTIYILYSHKDKRLYVGQTNNIANRLCRHNNGHVRATKFRRPLECIYTEECETLAKAYEREKYYKSLWASRFKKKLKDDFEKKLL